jgi:hypothetical protein
MVGHGRKGMTNIMTEGVRLVVDGFDDHAGDRWLGSNTSFVA